MSFPLRSNIQHVCRFFFFFNDTATTEIYTLSLHDALPIWSSSLPARLGLRLAASPKMRIRIGIAMMAMTTRMSRDTTAIPKRSEEHTSELQSRQYLVCRLLLEKKKNHRLMMSSCRA